MLDTYRQLVVNQYEAVLAGLNFCVDRCPEALWEAPVDGQPLCQIVFHALFYADVYLGFGSDGLRDQPFHHDHAASFADYEELEYRAPVLRYDRAFIKAYLAHCRAKAAATLAAETEAVLAGPSGFEGKNFARAELHVYNIRHLQDHMAQLNGFLVAQTGAEIPWFGSGWREVA
ncbi:MAG TPA: DinB family protein [Herpetosiphonaceae bacterium]